MCPIHCPTSPGTTGQRPTSPSPRLSAHPPCALHHLRGVQHPSPGLHIPLMSPTLPGLPTRWYPPASWYRLCCPASPRGSALGAPGSSIPEAEETPLASRDRAEPSPTEPPLCPPLSSSTLPHTAPHSTTPRSRQRVPSFSQFLFVLSFPFPSRGKDTCRAAPGPGTQPAPLLPQTKHPESTWGIIFPACLLFLLDAAEKCVTVRKGI